MQGITPGVVRVSVFTLPENTYVKSINFGGKGVNGKDLDLTASAGGEMQILLAPNGAEVTGTVRNANGKGLPSVIVQICDKNRRRPGSSFRDVGPRSGLPGAGYEARPPGHNSTWPFSHQ
jgi:hypothetical protein